MGFINKALGAGQIIGAIGDAVQGTSEVFHLNQTQKMQADAENFRAVHAQFSSEFVSNASLFEKFVNGLNRLPRPCMALGTLALFVYAMIDPAAFGERMNGLALVPEPMWWLLGAIVGFYFGARELHHFRVDKYEKAPIKNEPVLVKEPVVNEQGVLKLQKKPTSARAARIKSNNPAIIAWLKSQS